VSAGEASAALPPDRPWIASYPPGVPADYHLPEVPVTRLLDDALRDAPAGTALIAGDRSLDHATLHALVGEVAGWLRSDGIRPGDRIVVASSGQLSRCVLTLAIWRVAAAVVPVPATRDRDELDALIDELDVRGVIGPRRLVRAVDRPTLQVRWTVEDDRWIDRSGASRRRFARLRRPWRRGVEPGPGPTEGRRDLNRPDRRVEPAGDEPAPDVVVDLAPVLPVAVAIGPSASGEALVLPDTAGGALAWTHASLVAGAFQARLWIPDVQATQERILVADRLEAIEPIVLGWLLGLLAASPVVLPGATDTADLARDIAEQEPTVLIAPSRRLHGLVTDRGSVAGRDLRSLRVVLGHGGALPIDVVAAGERRMGGSRIRTVAPITDRAPMTHAQPVYGLLTPDTLGFPVTATDVLVVDPDGPDARHPVGPGSAGRLVVRGPQFGTRVAAGPGRVHEPEDGWVATDHLVEVSPEGVFTHLGVLGHLPERDGQPVATTPLETVIAALPGVVEVAVIPGGVPTEIVAVVAGARRSRPTVEQVTAHCAERLSGSVVPDRIVVVDELPHDAADRIDRAALRHRLAEEVTRG
jgi:long-chain acyl-CoA synthetase